MFCFNLHWNQSNIFDFKLKSVPICGIFAHLLEFDDVPVNHVGAVGGEERDGREEQHYLKRRKEGQRCIDGEKSTQSWHRVSLFIFSG